MGKKLKAKSKPHTRKQEASTTKLDELKGSIYGVTASTCSYRGLDVPARGKPPRSTSCLAKYFEGRGLTLDAPYGFELAFSHSGRRPMRWSLFVTGDSPFSGTAHGGAVLCLSDERGAFPFASLMMSLSAPRSVGRFAQRGPCASRLPFLPSLPSALVSVQQPLCCVVTLSRRCPPLPLRPPLLCPGAQPRHGLHPMTSTALQHV